MMRDAALAWYRAEGLEAWVNAQRACRDWPVVATSAVGRRSRGVTGQPDGGVLLAVGVPVLHPAVTRALAMAIAQPEERIRAVVAGRASVLDGAIVDDEYAGESGIAPVVDLAVAKLGSLGFSREELFPGHWPIPSLSARPLRTQLGEHPIDTELTRAAAQAEVLAAYERANAPALIKNEPHRLLQSAFDALVAHCGGAAPDPSLWIPSDARHVASFLRHDKGEGLSDEEVWAWFYQPRLPHGVDQQRTYREHPWAPRSSFVLGLVVIDAGVVVVLRQGLLVFSGGTWSPLLSVGPIRPLSTDGRHVAFLPAHPRGNHAPELFVLDSQAAAFVTTWPDTLPTRFVCGHWGAKSLVIWDRATRQERLLRSSFADDCGHHYHSPDGDLVWLADYPEDGVVSITDGSVVARLSRLRLDKKRGTFSRAFVLLGSGVFRSYVGGVLRDDAAVRWSAERAEAAAFSLDGSRLVTAKDGELRIRELGPEGGVRAESTVALPLSWTDLRTRARRVT
jgi:hypothetical protein